MAREASLHKSKLLEREDVKVADESRYIKIPLNLKADGGCPQ